MFKKESLYSVRRAVGNRQRGAALFVSMMILILLSMLALSASQVTSLQQKMTSAYWADLGAFESTEALLRQKEKELDLNNPDEPDLCAVPPMPGDVAGELVRNPPSAPTASYYMPPRGSGLAGSARVGQERELGATQNCMYFIVTAANFDNASDPSTMSIVQSVYVP